MTNFSYNSKDNKYLTISNYKSIKKFKNTFLYLCLICLKKFLTYLTFMISLELSNLI